MPCRAAEGGAVLEVWVQPRASSDGVAGVRDGAVKVRVTSPPVEGEANEALVRYLAKRLGVPRSGVRIVQGHTGRRKAVRIDGLGPDEVLARLGI